MKKQKVGGIRSITKSDLKSAATCMEIPKDILIEILMRLPTYSLMRFKCVSKIWFSLISSRYFTNIFLKFSSSTMRRRRVFLYAEDRHSFFWGQEQFSPILFSSSVSNLDSAFFLQLNHACLQPWSELSWKWNRFYFVNALRGLMCLMTNRPSLQIINLTTRQVLNVPCVPSNTFSKTEQCYEWNYFGYDPISDEYKLLRTISTTWELGSKRVRSQTQVLVLGAGASWRNIKSLSSPQSHHHPYGQGISINSVLYYGARSHMDIIVLMSFDFNSEEFSLIEFPIQVTDKWMGSLSLVNITNYQDQVAVIDCSRLKTECILELSVLEDAEESKWSHRTLVLPCHQLKLSLHLDESDELDIKGTSRSGEVKLSWRYDRYVYRDKKSTHHALYDLEKNRITRGVVIELPFPISFGETTLWEDVENIMYLEA